MPEPAPATARPVRAGRAGRAGRTVRAVRTVGADRERGALSLEAVLILPVVAVVVLGLLQVAALGRDLLLLHEAARAGARAAATTTGSDAPRRAAVAAAPELADLAVEVVPVARRAGQLATVTVRATRRLGPVDRELSARAVAHVEPTVGG